MTQQSTILNFFEKIFRSNIYLFLISRFLIGKYLSKFIYDSDFKIIKILEKNNFFDKNKLILDIGANDGMSYNIIRKFSKYSKIISFEPDEYNYKNLKKKEMRDKFFKCKKIGLSNLKKVQSFFIPFYKDYPISQMAGINKLGVKNRLKNSLYEKNLLKKIFFKKMKIRTDKLDNLKYSPSFIKIDIEGHEYECIQGSLKTIKKFKPIIMVEYDKKICNKIFTLIKKFKYEKFIYNKNEKNIEKYNNQKIFNLFFINEKDLRYISQ